MVDAQHSSLIMNVTKSGFFCGLLPYTNHDNWIYTIIRVHSAFSLVASCVLLKYTRTDDVN